MKSYLLLLTFASLLTGCTVDPILNNAQNKMAKINSAWERDNIEIFANKGTREYKGVSKTDAIKAMIIAFQKLNMIIQNSDANIGLITGAATYPKPLDYKELQVVIATETARAESIGPGFQFATSDFETKINVVFLELADGVRISIIMKRAYTGRLNAVTSSEMPPKAVELSLAKIWHEYEKVHFIQEKILK